MIAFNPDLIDVKVESEIVPTAPLSDELLDELKHGADVRSNWTMSVPEQGPMTYFRISPELRDFLKLCNEKHGVIGFEYDFEEGGLNFGLVLKKNEDLLANDTKASNN